MNGDVSSRSAPMRRLEHNEIVEECKTAMQQLVDEHDSFSEAEIVERVLAVHPELDRVRLEHAAAKCVKALERWPSAEQDEANWREATRHADPLITSRHLDEGLAYLK